VHTDSMVVASERVEFSVKVDRIPEKGMVQAFAPDGSDQSFHERVGHWDTGHRFDFLDLQNSQVCAPSVKSEQGVVIGTDSNGQCMSGNCSMEHAADRWTVDVLAANAKADDAPREHIQDHQDPMAAQHSMDSHRNRSTLHRLSLV